MITYEFCLSETRLTEIKTVSDLSRLKSSANHIITGDIMYAPVFGGLIPIALAAPL